MSHPTLSKLNEEIGKEFEDKFAIPYQKIIGIEDTSDMDLIKDFLLHSNERIFKAAIDLVRENMLGGFIYNESKSMEFIKGVYEAHSRLLPFLDELLK